MGKSTNSIAIFNSYVGLPEGKGWILCQICFVSYPKCLIFILWIAARRELKPEFRPLAATACVLAMVSTILVTRQGLVNVLFWEYWTSPYSSHYRPYT